MFDSKMMAIAVNQKSPVTRWDIPANTIEFVAPNNSERNCPMSEQIMPEDFESLTRKFYKFLEDDFGFSIKKLNDWAFVAETGSTKLSIYLEYYSALVVEIEPIGEGASQLLRQNILPSSMTILSVIKY